MLPCHVSVPVAQADLDSWARSCHDAYADLTLAKGRLLHEGDIHAARQFLHPAREEMWHILQALVRAGATRPQAPPPVPLALLSIPANHRLGAILQEAVEAAEAVDQERGTAPSNCLADRLRRILAEVETELYGPGEGRQ